MVNYDDIFGSQQPKETGAGTQFSSFDKESWAAQKQQDRDSAYSMIEQTAQRMAVSGELFKSFLDVQSRFDRYSVGNALLITAQRPDMTEPADAKTWKDKGVYIKKGETGVLILEPGDEYTREDGSVGVSYNPKRIFDITQTTSRQKKPVTASMDPRMLLTALIHNAPCKIEISAAMPENVCAVYKPEEKVIRVRQGMDAPDIFRSLSSELAHAHLDKGDYKRSENAFTAYCVSYILCMRNNIAKDAFRFERLPESLSTMDAQKIRAELGKIREVANEISADMKHYLDKAKPPKTRDDGAR